MPEHRLTRGSVRDPVHGYVFTTTIERAILDDPLAQRLRGVGQSAAAQLVFPSMTVTRFAHSLGAMHVASRFFAATLANAREALRDELLTAMVELIAAEEEEVLGRREGVTEENERLMLAQGLMGYGETDLARKRLAALICEQALRLVSLLHDLGHLPFSHDFEDALAERLVGSDEIRAQLPYLAELTTTGGKLHEAIGSKLADWVQDELRGELSARLPAELRELARASLRVAKRILHATDAEKRLSKTAADRVSRWLYSLVSGEIDADRCDYILRDSRNYGLIGAGYDLQRLVANLGVEPAGDEDPEWRTVILAHGVSAAEEFLVARYRMYEWAIYHHKIQQSAAGLRRALRWALGRSDAELVQFLADVEELVSPSSPTASPEELRPHVARFVDYTDAWWVERLKRSVRASSTPEDIRAWARLFLYRAHGPRSLWKKPTDLAPSDLKVLTAAAALAAAQHPAWSTVVREAETEDRVLLVAFNWRPWKAADAERPVSQLEVFEPASGALRPLSTVSPLVGALAEAWSQSLQVLAFVVNGDELKDTEELGTVREAVLERLRKVAVAQPKESQ